MAEEEFGVAAIIGITIGATLLVILFFIVCYVLFCRRNGRRQSQNLDVNFSPNMRYKTSVRNVKGAAYRRSDESVGDRPLSNQSKGSLVINPQLLTTYQQTGRYSYDQPLSRYIEQEVMVDKRESLGRSGEGTGYTTQLEGYQSPRKDAGTRVVSMINNDNYLYSVPMKQSHGESFDTDGYSQTIVFPDEDVRPPSPTRGQHVSHIVYMGGGENHYATVDANNYPPPDEAEPIIQVGSSASLEGKRKAWMTSSQGGYTNTSF